MSRQLEYMEVLNMYPSGASIIYAVDENTVNYFVPVCPGSTYTVVLTEVSNRLRMVYSNQNPLTITSTKTSGVSIIVENPSFSVGYTKTYTATEYGYLVIYVSNIGQRPLLSIETDGVGGDDIYNSFCSQVSSNTSLSSEVLAKADDWVFCAVTTRSDTTYPSDWSLLHISQILPNTSQRMALLCKKIENNGYVDVTITQSSAARMYINLLSMSDIGGFRYIEGYEKYFSSGGGPSFEADKPLVNNVLWACSTETWLTNGPPYKLWSCDSLTHPVVSLGENTQSRQAIFIDSEDGQNRIFTIPTSSTGVVIDCVEILPTYDRKYLIRSEDTLYTVVDEVLSPLVETEVAADTFRTYGLTLIPDEYIFMALVNPEILCWQDSADNLPGMSATMTAAPLTQTIIAEPFYLIDSTIKGVDSVECTYSGSPLIALSFNEGAFEYYDATNGWIEAEDETGMSPETIIALTSDDWTTKLADIQSIRIRVVLDSTDDSFTSIIFNFIN